MEKLRCPIAAQSLEYGPAEKKRGLNMLQIIAATAAALQITFAPPPASAPKPTCNIKTVSYKFTGTPGTEFRYDGEKFVMPKTGSIELIASKKATDAEIAGHKVTLDVFPTDEFGTRTVPLSIADASTTTTK